MKILIVSDIHANWPALWAVIQSEPAANFKRILCLGDLVNYGPHPVECVKWAIEYVPREWLIQGNHDYAVGLNDDPHCSTAYSALADATQKISARLLTSEMKSFLANLTPLHHFELEGARCVACHASPKDPLFHYMPETAPVTFWESELTLIHEPDFLFLGHTHVPMKTRFRRTLVINPGSVGQPKHGDPRAAFAIWEDGEVTLHRQAYDVEETIRGYDGLGLDPHVTRILCDVLRTGGEVPAEQFYHTWKPHSYE